MPTSTREFSVCLIPDEDTAKDIYAIRRALPASPYRDDAPHITLLRGITAPNDLSDDELLTSIAENTQIDASLPIQANVQEVTNKSNQFYTSTGLLLLGPSPELLHLRNAVSSTLQVAGYMVEQQEQTSYTPHITVRLGVPLEGEVFQNTSETFLNKNITFGRWVLFRLMLEEGSRQMKEIHF